MWSVDVEQVADWLASLDDRSYEQVFAAIELLQERGPQLGRPIVDTVAASRHKNMKELRFKADDGVWRVAFAFDPSRKAILLCGGDKSGVSTTRFYKVLIASAEARYKQHLKGAK